MGKRICFAGPDKVLACLTLSVFLGVLSLTIPMNVELEHQTFISTLHPNS
jgi:hypothetical protein